MTKIVILLHMRLASGASADLKPGHFHSRSKCHPIIAYRMHSHITKIISAHFHVNQLLRLSFRVVTEVSKFIRNVPPIGRPACYEIANTAPVIMQSIRNLEMLDQNKKILINQCHLRLQETLSKRTGQLSVLDAKVKGNEARLEKQQSELESQRQESFEMTDDLKRRQVQADHDLANTQAKTTSATSLSVFQYCPLFSSCPLLQLLALYSAMNALTDALDRTQGKLATSNYHSMVRGLQVPLGHASNQFRKQEETHVYGLFPTHTLSKLKWMSELNSSRPSRENWEKPLQG